MNIMTDSTPESKPANPLNIKHPAWFLLIPLAIMMFFDQIIWKKQFGLQFLILTLLVLAGVFILVIIEKKRVPWQPLLLLFPILFGAVMTIFRQEASTTFVNVVLTLWGLVLLALTLLNGQWMLYRMREVLMGFLRLMQSALIDPIRLVLQNSKANASLPPAEKKTTAGKVWPYLRGVLIAIPLLLALGALLASADPIFEERLAHLFDWLKFEDFGEFVVRVIYILLLAYILAGAYILALTHSAEKKAINPDQPFFPPFLGHAEAFTVLLLVNLLFASFLIVQFQYFFAGEANISLEGFTYAEYARRGFFELVAVTLISLGLFYLLSLFTKRSTKKERRIFSILSVLLILQVGVMLISAFQRLSLYEAAYGFTHLRTITHVFMVWLGVLLAAMAVMEVFSQFRRLAFALFLIFFGFTLTLNTLNVDRFIAEHNIEHAIAGNPLDASFLVWNMSDDGWPTLFEYSQAKTTPGEVRNALDATLACANATRIDRDEESPFWASYHVSGAKADALFEENAAALNDYPFIQKEESIFIEVNGEELWCKSSGMD
jgi:hypothetical protein